MKVKLIVGTIVLLCFVSGVESYARESRLAGKGSIDGFVKIFCQDVIYLENELSNLMSECGRE